jgi:nitroalkane oxidase
LPGSLLFAVARMAYEYTLQWAKTYTDGGDQPIISHQVPGYMLADIAMLA